MKPYYEDEQVQLFHGDCREILPGLDVTADLLTGRRPLLPGRGPWANIHHDVPTTSDATARRVHRKAKPAHHQGSRGPSVYASEEGGPRLMRSVIYCRSMHGRAINETEKPTGLIEPLIEYGCTGGGLVVDLFSGSGAVLLAAKLTGRKAIGFDTREAQCEGAARRLAQGVLLGGDVA